MNGILLFFYFPPGLVSKVLSEWGFFSLFSDYPALVLVGNMTGSCC